MKRWVRSPAGAWECSGTVSIPPILLTPDRRPLFRSTSHRIKPYSMAKSRAIQDDTERDITADSQTTAHNHPFSHHCTDQPRRLQRNAPVFTRACRISLTCRFPYVWLIGTMMREWMTLRCCLGVGGYIALSVVLYVSAFGHGVRLDSMAC